MSLFLLKNIPLSPFLQQFIIEFLIDHKVTMCIYVLNLQDKFESNLLVMPASFLGVRN